MAERRRAGSNVERPLKLVRLRVEFELVAPADLDDTVLAMKLTDLSHAGLRDNLLSVVRVEMNGSRFAEAENIVDRPGDPARLRPAPDQRLVAAAYEVRRVAEELYRVLGLAARADPEAQQDAVG